MTVTVRVAIVAVVLALLGATFETGWVAAQTMPPQPPPTQAEPAPPPQPPPLEENQFSSNELIDAGHRFFGSVSQGLAMVVEKAVFGANRFPRRRAQRT